MSASDQPCRQSASKPIADYGLIGDMRGAALVAMDGSIDWLCLGRFDADPVLLALLDADRGGSCSLSFDGGMVAVDRRYVDGTNVLETRFADESRSVVVTDFMPVRDRPDAGVVGADSESADRVVRLILCERGEATVTVRVAPTFDWSRRRALPHASDHHGSYRGEDFWVASSARLEVDGSLIVVRATLEASQRLIFILGKGETADLEAVAEATDQLAETTRYWRRWIAQCSYAGPHASLVARSALCLKLLTHAPSGGMIAAPTAGLPEVVGGIRNWDYRYVWTRDASFSVSAFLNLGFRREAAEFLRFLHEACDHGEAVRVLYAVEGTPPDIEELTELAGWNGSLPINVGNDAGEQDQFEIYGELLAAVALYVDKFGREGLCEELVADLPAFVTRLAEAAIKNWRSPDQGIWELKGQARQMLHTKAMCWIALERAIELAPLLEFEAPPHWRGERDRIHADCLKHGWNDRRQALTMEYGGDALDMALLRLPLLKFMDAKDPRITATLAAMDEELGSGDLYRRYRMDDGLPGDEGAFLACSFWVAGVLIQRGDLDRAAPMIERLLSHANDLGLYAEQMDIATGAQLGNFPQAFTHMTVIHEVLRLHEATTSRTHGESSSGHGYSAGAGA